MISQVRVVWGVRAEYGLPFRSFRIQIALHRRLWLNIRKHCIVTFLFPCPPLTQHNPLLITNLPQPLQPLLRRRHIPPLTQHRLNHDTSDFVRWDLLLEEEGEMGEAEFGEVGGGGVGVEVELGGVGEGGWVDAGLGRRYVSVGREG